MDNRLTRNYSLFLPPLIGIISLFGICLILVSARFPRQNTQVVATQTVTPFKYLLLATETIVPTPGFETATVTEIFSSPTSEGDLVLSAVVPSLTLTEQNGISTDEFFTPIVTITPNPIFAESNPMTGGVYDDTDSEIIRHGNWKSQNKADAYEQTLLVSNTVGNYVAFSFTGRYLVLGYQSTEDAGDLAVNIDGSEERLSQSEGNSWFSQDLGPGTHFVLLIHHSGSSVNFDYINIPG